MVIAVVVLEQLIEQLRGIGVVLDGHWFLSPLGHDCRAMTGYTKLMTPPYLRG